MTAAPPTARVPIGLVLALGGLSSFGPLASDLYLPALPDLAGDLMTTEAAAQLTLSVCLIGLALGQLLVGPITDRVGRRGPLLIGVALFALTSGLCALAPSIELLLVLRLLAGLAGGAGIVVARAMARDLYSGARLARVFALLMLVGGVAPIAAPVLGGQILRFTDWRGVFWALALIGLVLLGAALTRGETLPVERRRAGGLRETGRVLRALFRDRSFLSPALVQGLGIGAMFTYIAMGTFVLQQVYGLSPQAFAVVFGVNALGLVLLAQVSGALAGRVGPRALLTVGVLLALAAAVALLVGVLVSDSVWALLPPLWVLVGCTGLIGPNATALALAEQGHAAGTASAVIGLVQFGLGAIIPPLASLGGVTPLVMVSTMLTTAVLAAVVHVLGARAPTSTPSRTRLW